MDLKFVQREQEKTLGHKSWAAVCDPSKLFWQRRQLSFSGSLVHIWPQGQHSCCGRRRNAVQHSWSEHTRGSRPVLNGMAPREGSCAELLALGGEATANDVPSTGECSAVLVGLNGPSGPWWVKWDEGRPPAVGPPGISEPAGGVLALAASSWTSKRCRARRCRTHVTV